jgi:excisionase family DNA binding protein
MPSSRITVVEVAKRLGIGKMAVYGMLGKGILPALRVGRRWIITRQAYEQWERTCGIKAVGAVTHPEFLT